MSDDSGRVLDAEYSVEPDGGHLAVVLESMSGRAEGRAPRNTDYRAALELLLKRLQERRAVIETALVDSRRTQFLPPVTAPSGYGCVLAFPATTPPTPVA